MNKRKIGTEAEGKAETFLKQLGYQILKKNFYTRSGEIDLIARDNQTIVFIEVRFRKNASFGTPLESITNKKITSICRTAQIFMGPLEAQVRFDVIAITGDKIEHLKNAFDFCL